MRAVRLRFPRGCPAPDAPDAAPDARHTCILVVESALEGVASVIGLVVDAVSEVIELGADEIEAPPAFGSGVALDRIVGMGRVGRRFVHLLDVERLLAAGGGAPAEVGAAS